MVQALVGTLAGTADKVAMVKGTSVVQVSKVADIAVFVAVIAIVAAMLLMSFPMHYGGQQPPALRLYSTLLSTLQDASPAAPEYAKLSPKGRLQ